jgi:kynureninase
LAATPALPARRTGPAARELPNPRRPARTGATPVRAAARRQEITHVRRSDVPMTPPRLDADLAERNAEELDRADPLAPFRARFDLPEEVIYLDGNSLGPLPKATRQHLDEVITREWGRDLIRSWDENGWMDLPLRVGAKVGRLIGAEPHCTAACDSTSINLFKALAAALALRPDRRTILSEAGNFPTDLYIAQGLAALLDRDHEIRLLAPEAIETGLDEDVAVVMLTHVNYRTGRMHDMTRLTAAAGAAGALVIWDLSHSAGAVPLDMAGCSVDFAVGCGYKFLNGGPGAPAFLYMAPRHQETAPPLSGWMGHASPFDFDPAYRPRQGIRRALVGTPAILSLAALEMGVDMALEADMAAIRAKSVRMADMFVDFVDANGSGLGLRVVSPRAAGMRGSQVCIAHSDAAAIMRRLIARGVIGDFRPPDILRFGMTPLTLRYVDIIHAAEALIKAARAG